MRKLLRSIARHNMEKAGITQINRSIKGRGEKGPSKIQRYVVASGTREDITMLYIIITAIIFTLLIGVAIGFALAACLTVASNADKLGEIQSLIDCELEYSKALTHDQMIAKIDAYNEVLDILGGNRKETQP